MKLEAESYLKTGSNELRVLEYRVNGLSFGINILKVSKIVHGQADFTRIPETGEAISGIFRDIEKVVPLVDLSTQLAIGGSAEKREKVIVTEFFGKVTGFLVDQIDWIHHFVWEDIIDADTVFRGLDHRYVIGIVKPTEDRMVQLLDYESILLDLCPHLREKAVASYQGHADFSGRHVLIAEDSPSVRAMLIAELNDLGFETVATSDGHLAWEAFQKQPFDLVISDVEMPQMDGMALTLNIRNSDRPNTPVIVYSSIGDAGMKARASFLKADAHVTKLNLDELINTAEKLLRGETVEKIGPQTVEDESELVTVPI